MSTRTELLNGADFEGNEAYCDAVVNAIKNHFPMSDPQTNMTNPVYGIISVDEDDNRVYLYIGESGELWREVLVRIPVVNASLGGAPSDAQLDAIFTSPAEIGNGGHRFVRDIDSGGVLYHVVSDGTNYWYQAMTMAV